MREIRRPTRKFVESYLKSKNVAKYFGAEPALAKLFQAFPNNNDFDEVFLKVVCLNDIYNTRIFGTYRVAEEICNLRVDERIKKKDISVVTDLDGSKPNGRSIYSFATKYCSWHDNEAFPIYDRYAGAMLFHYLKLDGIADVYKYQLLDYPAYVSAIIQFRAYYELKDIGIKQIDKFLWLYGKEYF